MSLTQTLKNTLTGFYYSELLFNLHKNIIRDYYVIYTEYMDDSFIVNIIFFA